MANTPKKLYQNQLPSASGTTFYTVPASTTTIVSEVLITNRDTSARTYTLRMGTNSNTDDVFDAISCPAGDTHQYGMNTVLEAADIITGFVDTSGNVNMRISGMEIT